MRAVDIAMDTGGEDLHAHACSNLPSKCQMLPLATLTSTKSKRCLCLPIPPVWEGSKSTQKPRWQPLGLCSNPAPMSMVYQSHRFIRGPTYPSVLHRWEAPVGGVRCHATTNSPVLIFPSVLTIFLDAMTTYYKTLMKEEFISRKKGECRRTLSSFHTPNKCSVGRDSA